MNRYYHKFLQLFRKSWEYFKGAFLKKLPDDSNHETLKRIMWRVLTEK